MNKKKMILTSLASVAVLGAAFVASQTVSPWKLQRSLIQLLLNQLELLQLLNQKWQVQKLNKLKLTLKKAEEKVTEAQAKVDTTTATAKEADTKLEAEKKESADADAAKN